MILSAKAIDGVYDSDPKLDPNARKYDKISMSDVVTNKLQVMDLAAAVLAMEHNMPMKVFGLNEDNSIHNALHHDNIGTLVYI